MNAAEFLEAPAKQSAAEFLEATDKPSAAEFLNATDGTKATDKVPQFNTPVATDAQSAYAGQVQTEQAMRLKSQQAIERGEILPVTGWDRVKQKLGFLFDKIFGSEGSYTRKQNEAIAQVPMISGVGMSGRLGQLFMAYFAAKTAADQPEIARQIIDEAKSGNYSQAQRDAIQDALQVTMAGAGVAGLREANIEKLKANTEAAGAPQTAAVMAKTVASSSAKATEDKASAEKIVSAAVKTNTGIATGPNHPEILQKLGMEVPPADQRNTPDYGFMTDQNRFVTREEAAKLATANGQNLKEFEPGEPAHSDEVAAAPGSTTPISETKQDIVSMGGLAPGDPNEPVGKVPASREVTGVAERVRKQREAAEMTAPTVPGKGINPEASVQRGRQLLNEGVDPEQTMQNFEKTMRVSSDDMAVVRAHQAKLAKATNASEEKFGTESPEFKAARDVESAWAARTKAMQTEWARAGHAQQGEEDIDTGTFSGLQRAKRDVTGENFTPSEGQKATKVAAGVKEATERVQEATGKLQSKIDEQTKAAQKALDEASKRVREAASAGAEAENQRRIAAAGKRPDAGTVEHVRYNLLGFKKGKMDADLVNSLWAYAKKAYIDKGNLNLADIVHKIGDDTGLSPKDILKGMSSNREVKRLSDEAWQRQKEYRRLHETAKRWVEDLNETWLKKLIPSTARKMFALKVAGHGTVAMGTHAPLTAFSNPFIFARNFGKMYKLVASPQYYDMQMVELKRRANYTVAQRAGLVNDPALFEDFTNPKMAQQYPALAKYFGRFAGMGTRGYFVLKPLRQDLFDKHWDALSESEKTPAMAKAIADTVNHLTGVVSVGGGPIPSMIFFAPKLELSRAAVLVGDPYRAFTSLRRMSNMKPEEKWFALNQIKEKSKIATVWTSLILANQALNYFLGDKKTLNITDPMKSDFMKFRIAGMNFAWGGPFLSMMRLPLRIYQIGASDGGKMRNLIYPDESMEHAIGDYARSQLSPAASLVVTLLTKADYQGRPLPQIPLYGKPVPEQKRLKAEGVEPYTWPEFFAETVLPIPGEEAAKEVWHYGIGETPEQKRGLEKSFLTLLVMTATGGRLTDDWNDVQVNNHPPGSVEPGSKLPGSNPPGTKNR